MKFYNLCHKTFETDFSELYSGFSTSVATKTFVTSHLQVEKGVLQGDCLSPLLFNMLFNMLFNTFIQTTTILSLM